MLLGIFDWIGDFFKSMFDMIPKTIYLLWASISCVIDVLQLFFRKLAGLDVYWNDGKKVSGDLVTDFITGILGINENGFTYSALSTVFWSFIVFGVIICFAAVLVAIIKSHYSYDEKAAKGPMQYVYTGLKAIINMAVVPVIVVLGLFVSQAVLTALDTITSVSSGNVISLYGSDKMDLLMEVPTSRSTSANSANKNEKTYIFYDIFGYGCNIKYGNHTAGSIDNDLDKLGRTASTNQTFSGAMFKVAAYNGNRARKGQMSINNQNYSGGKNDSMTLFGNARDNDELADMIDTAFACTLHLKTNYNLNYSFNGGIVSKKYFTNFLTTTIASYSKFNVGLVWYYYDLWDFNYIVGFASIIVCSSLLINVILGLITRLFMCIGLFLIAPPLFGLAPLDGGKAGKGWTENFMKQVLMAYGAVVGMNIFFLILPYMNNIKFFNIGVADLFAQTLIIIVGLVTIKAFISTVSSLIGGADANDTGGKIAEEVGNTIKNAAAMPGKTIGGIKTGAKFIGNTAKTLGRGLQTMGSALNAGRHKTQQLSQNRKAKKADKKAGFAQQSADETKKATLAQQAADRAQQKIDEGREDIMAYNRRNEDSTQVDKALEMMQRTQGASKDERERLNRQASKLLSTSGLSERQIEALQAQAKTGMKRGLSAESIKNNFYEGLHRNASSTVKQKRELSAIVKQKREEASAHLTSASAFAKKAGLAEGENVYKFVQTQKSKAAQHSMNATRHQAAAGTSIRNAGKHAKQTGKAAVATGKTALEAGKGVLGTVADATGDNKMVKGMRKAKEDAATTAAKNTAKSAEQNTKIAAWQAQHPGEPMPDDVLEEIMTGKKKRKK